MTRASGHSFWLEPSSFNPPEGSLVTFTLRVGEHFIGEEFVRHPTHLKTFELRTTDPRNPALDIPGRTGSSPAGYIRVAKADSWIASYTSEFSTTALSPEKFREYIAAEGLAAQVPAAKIPGDREIREMFGRNAKTLLGLPGGVRSDRPVGMMLELVCESPLLSLPAGGQKAEISWQLLFAGRPLPDRTVFLESKAAATVVASGISDKDGRVRFTVADPGVYLVRAINIVPAEEPGVDWRSHWTSTTFSITAAVTPAKK
jgi:hypothetical protein